MDAPALRSSSPEHVEIEWAPPRLTGGMPISGYKVQRAEAGQLDFKDMHPGVIIPPENHTYSQPPAAHGREARMQEVARHHLGTWMHGSPLSHTTKQL